jgi:glucose dehydrogenase
MAKQDLSSVFESDPDLVATRSDVIDYLIVGSGTAGITTALQLAKWGYSILLIEAGPLWLLQHLGSSPVSGRLDLIPKVHQPVVYRLPWVRDISELETACDKASQPYSWSLVGGRTVFWAGCAPRFISEEFDPFPFSYAEFQPYYDQAESLIHVTGTSLDRPDFITGDVQNSVLHNLQKREIPARTAPLAIDTRSAINGYIPRGFDSAIDRLLRSGKLVRFGEGSGVALSTNVQVVKLEANGNIIERVHVLHNRKDPYELRPKNVILAGGAIQSARLALASGLCPGNDHQGAFIGEHVMVTGLMQLPKPPGGPIYTLIPAVPGRSFQMQIQGPISPGEASPFYSTAWLNFDRESSVVLCCCFGSVPAVKENRLILTNSGKSSGHLQDCAVIYNRTPEERNLINQIKEFMNDVAMTLGGTFDEFHVAEPGSSLHEFGGLRMGASGAGVTDSDGCFRDYVNLSCADAATWPYQGAANPYLTITATALRHADSLERRDKDSMLSNRQMTVT